MPNIRTLLVITLAALSFMIWVEWQQDYGQTRQTPGAPASTDSEATPERPAGDDASPAGRGGQPDLPQPVEQPASGDVASQPTTEAPGSPDVDRSDWIPVRTDVLDLRVDPRGGTLVSARLLEYPVDVDTPDQKVHLLHRRPGEMFVAQSGLLSRDRPAPNHTVAYRLDREAYALQPGADTLRVPMVWQGEGVRVEKIYVFKRGSYTVAVEHRVINTGDRPWNGNLYAQLQRTEPGEDGGGFSPTSRVTYSGAAYYSPADKYTKESFSDLRDQPLDRQVTGGWIAMVEHYFLAAWIPPAEQPRYFESSVIGGNAGPRYVIRHQSGAVEVGPGQAHSFEDRLVLGPKKQKQLAQIAPGLELTVDYGIFTVFSKPLFWLLDKIYSVVGNWGWAIVLLTVLIKLAFYKLTEAQYRSMARMRKLQPRIEALKERYGDDRQKMSQAMMELYRTEKVNPMGGCLPILVQIPIFIALYWVLLESVELRQAPFIFWIKDLSSPDPLYVLPVINGAAMIMTQRMTPAPGMDPMQRRMMNALPVVFSVLFAFFPAGLVLYWATNAVISLAQQWVITRRIDQSD